MRVLKVIVAVIITLILLYIARTNSRGQPEYYSHTENGYGFEYTSVPKGLENTSVAIPLTITGPLSDSARPVFVRLAGDNPVAGEFSQIEAVPMQPCDSAADCYSTVVQAGAKGGRFYYYIEIQDAGGATLAKFAEPDGTPFLFRYIGAVPTVVLVSHIVAIFATVFFVAMGATHAFSLVRGGTDVRPLARYSFLAALCAFHGGYPFGIPMNWYAFGVLWEGVPFGTDATDNKTQLLLVYLLFVTLSTLGSLTRGKWGRDIFSPRTLGWFGIGSAAFMLFIYLIPHSIQFSPALTYVVCYSFIALMALIYIVGRVKSAGT